METRKEVLKKEKQEIEAQLKKIESESTDFGSDVDGGDEESHETEAINLKLGLTQQFKNRLAEIETELKKLE